MNEQFYYAYALLTVTHLDSINDNLRLEWEAIALYAHMKRE